MSSSREVSGLLPVAFKQGLFDLFSEGCVNSQSILAEKAASGHKSPLSQEANPLLDICGQLSCSLFLHFSAVVRELLIGVSSQGKQAQ